MFLFSLYELKLEKRNKNLLMMKTGDMVRQRKDTKFIDIRK